MRVLLLMCCAVLSGCADGPLTWDDVRYVAMRPQHSPVGGARAVPRPAGVTCASSLQFAETAAGQYAVWWSVRPDSSAVLLVARAEDGSRWGTPVVADSRDRSVRGCARPAPAIAVDAQNRYVHLAYFLEPPEGAGVFYAHSMDQGGMFHSPVAAVYGERPSAATVASQGDTVVVAYEDPNSSRSRVSIAVSRTAGHIFRERLPVSGTMLPATRPAVSLERGMVSVSWTETGMSDSTSQRTAIRVGRWR